MDTNTVITIVFLWGLVAAGLMVRVERRRDYPVVILWPISGAALVVFAVLVTCLGMLVWAIGDGRAPRSRRVHLEGPYR